MDVRTQAQTFADKHTCECRSLSFARTTLTGWHCKGGANSNAPSQPPAHTQMTVMGVSLVLNVVFNGITGHHKFTAGHRK
eukprot:5546871-Alexandrium_andersonii.AAC.1